MSPTCTQAGTLAARALWLVLLPEETRVLSYPLTSPHLSYIMKLSHSQETARLVRPTAHTQCPGGYRTHGKNTRNIHHISLDHSNYNLCNWIFFSVTLIYTKPNFPRAIFFTSMFSWEDLIPWSIFIQWVIVSSIFWWLIQPNLIFLNYCSFQHFPHFFFSFSSITNFVMWSCQQCQLYFVLTISPRNIHYQFNGLNLFI